jgi:hypothetical protein
MKKTIYQTNYENRLNEMLDLVIRKYGYEHENTIYFAEMVHKYIDNACYKNRETMEKIFKGLVK